LVDFETPLPLLVGLLTFFVALTTPVRESLKAFSLSFLLLPAVAFVCTGLVGSVAVIVLSGPGLIAPRVEHFALMHGVLAVMAVAVLMANLPPLRRTPIPLARTGAVAVLMVLAWQVWTDGTFSAMRDVGLGAGWAYRGGVAERIATLDAAVGGSARVREVERPPYPVFGLNHGPPSEMAYQRNLKISFGLTELVFIPCGDSTDPYWCHYRFNPQDGIPPEVLLEGQYDGPGMEIQRQRLAGQ
jgi:hypothetical protein